MTVLRPDLLACVRPWLLPAHAVDLLNALDTSDAPAHADRFAGDPVRAHGPWPQCPACGNALAFIAQFRAQGQFWRFFYCLNCNPWDDDERESGQVRLEHEPLVDGNPASPTVQRAPSSFGLVPHAWESEPVLSAPSFEDVEVLKKTPEFAAWLRSEPKDAEAVFESWNVRGQSGTRLGGYEHPIQSAIAPCCAQCGQVMPLLARIDSEDAVGLMWGDMGAIYLHACPDHPDQQHFELQCY